MCCKIRKFFPCLTLTALWWIQNELINMYDHFCVKRPPRSEEMKSLHSWLNGFVVSCCASPSTDEPQNPDEISATTLRADTGLGIEWCCFYECAKLSKFHLMTEKQTLRLLFFIYHAVLTWAGKKSLSILCGVKDVGSRFWCKCHISIRRMAER